MSAVMGAETRFNKIQGVVFALFLSLFFMEFLERHGLVVREMTWIPELISIGLLLVIVLFIMPQIRVLHLSFWYVFLFILIIFCIVSSILLNKTDPLVIVLGIRNYLKYIPFFLLPVVYRFSDEQIKSQLKLLIIIGLIQLPIALYQRFVISHGLTTGDHVRGTLVTSSYLSIFLICTMVIVLAFRMRKHISLKQTVTLGILLLLPTTINETKGTLILLPAAFISLAVFTPGLSGKIKRLAGYMLVLVVFLAVFIPIYDHFFMPRYNKSITHFVTEDKGLEKLIAPSSLEVSEKREGRGDRLIQPFIDLDDPFELLFGLSIGNTSDSVFGEDYNGEYYDEYKDYNNLAFGLMIYELGVLGTLISLMIWLRIFIDAKFLSKSDGFKGSFAIGWMGVMVVLALSLAYKNIITAQAISYLFWFYSGYIASMSYRYKYS